MRRLLAELPLLLVAVVARADEEKPEVQRMRFIERGQNLTATGSISKLFDSGSYENDESFSRSFSSASRNSS